MNQLLLLYTTPFYVIVIAIEIILSNSRRLHFYSVKETVVNIYLNLLNSGIDLVLRLLLGLPVLLFFFRFHLQVHLSGFWYWALLLLGEDLLFWLEHYVDHMSRFFWAVHVTHHSSPEYNLTTGFRSSVLMPVYKYFYFIPLVLLNFNPVDAIFMYSATQIYGILVHTRFVGKLPRIIEYIFVTPSHHRVHHARNTPYLDRNMGMVFIVWDRLFGTFTEEMPGEIPQYGITSPLSRPHHPLHIVSHEWEALFRDMKKKPLWLRLQYMFRPPGWSHDGTTKTTRQLQHEYYSLHKSPPATTKP